MLDRLLAWARDSFWLRAVALLVVSGILTDVGSHKAWATGWHGTSPAGRIMTVFLIPLAIVWGGICAIFLIKFSPRRFVSADELSEDADTRRRARDNQWFFLMSAFFFAFFLALPILLVAWGLSELGLKS